MLKEQLLSRDDVDAIDAFGKVLYFSIRRFIDEIAGGNVCFICGADPAAVKFNDEHVIPDWILAEYNLHSRRITLPNNAGLMYGQYTVPCCESCNTRMSEVFEYPISRVIKQGYEQVLHYVANGGVQHIFQWLALIYLKTHLKDRSLRYHLDRRKGEETLADLYDWRDLHHIHCVARMFHTHAVLQPAAMGSVLICPARTIEGEDVFDYADSYIGSTVLLRLGETAFIAVLNDGCAVWSLLRDDFERIAGPLSSIQLREILARMACTNVHLADRPKLHSKFEHTYYKLRFPNLVMADGEYTISADHPETVEVKDIDPMALGAMLSFYVGGPAKLLFGAEASDRLLKDLEDGMHSTIFGSKGEFLVNPAPREGEDLRPAKSESIIY